MGSVNFKRKEIVQDFAKIDTLEAAPTGGKSSQIQLDHMLPGQSEGEEHGEEDYEHVTTDDER